MEKQFAVNVEELRTAWVRGVKPEAVNAQLAGADLRGADLQGADLRRANLAGVNLAGADLRGADLRGADMRYANLAGADLRHADLWHADLGAADLRYADMRYANLWAVSLAHTNLAGIDFILQLRGMPSGELILWPTPKGWALQVGCWKGAVDDLRELIAGDEGWPEAYGDEVAKRRPFLEAALTLCDLHMARHANQVTMLAEQWKEKN